MPVKLGPFLNGCIILLADCAVSIRHNHQLY
jgi:hypothetical protein